MIIFGEIISKYSTENYVGLRIGNFTRIYIDWASRPYGDNAFEGKPVAMMSAPIGMLGGARAQHHLQQSFVFLDMHPLNRPEVMVTFAGEKFDGAGKLLDPKAKELIKELLKELVLKS